MSQTVCVWWGVQPVVPPPLQLSSIYTLSETDREAGTSSAPAALHRPDTVCTAERESGRETLTPGIGLIFEVKKGQTDRQTLFS